MKVKSLSRVRLFATPWTGAHQAPLSLGFSRQEYWSGLPFPSPGELPDPGIEPRSPALQADALTSEPPGKPTLQQENRLNEKPRHRNEQRPFTATRKSESEVAQSCPTLCNAMDCSLPDSSCPWDSPGKNTGVGCHFLLQGSFPTQGLNPGPLHCRQILYQLSHQGSSSHILISC